MTNETVEALERLLQMHKVALLKRTGLSGEHNAGCCDSLRDSIADISQELRRARAEAKEAPEPDKLGEILAGFAQDVNARFMRMADRTHDLEREVAKEAPEPERRDALLRLKQKCSDYEKSLIPHYRWYKLMEDIDAEIAKQPAKEAPAGEKPSRWVGDVVERAHAELDKAGIPEGALDERVRALSCESGMRQGVLIKERDAARQEAALYREAEKKRECGGCNYLRQELADLRDKELRALRTMEKEMVRACTAEKELAEKKAQCDNYCVAAKKLRNEAIDRATAAEAEVERLLSGDEWSRGAVIKEAEEQRDAAIARAENAEQRLANQSSCLRDATLRAEKAEKESDALLMLQQERDYWRDLTMQARRTLKLDLGKETIRP